MTAALVLIAAVVIVVMLFIAATARIIVDGITRKPESESIRTHHDHLAEYVGTERFETLAAAYAELNQIDRYVHRGYLPDGSYWDLLTGKKVTKLAPDDPHIEPVVAEPAEKAHYKKMNLARRCGYCAGPVTEAARHEACERIMSRNSELRREAAAGTRLHEHMTAYARMMGVEIPPHVRYVSVEDYRNYVNAQVRERARPFPGLLGTGNLYVAKNRQQDGGK